MKPRSTAPAVKLRAHREGIAYLEAQGYTVRPVRFSRGDHLIVRVEDDRGVSTNLTIAGSPSGSYLDAMVTKARHGLRLARERRS